MPPNPKVHAAYRAMKDLGITEIQVKPVLKRLLRLYDKNWEMIEEENYRVLADAIFDEDETKASEQKMKSRITGEEEEEEGAQMHEEPERPLKRLRLRGQEGHASSSVSNHSPRMGGPTLKRPKVEEEEIPATFCSQQSQDMMESPQPAIEKVRDKSQLLGMWPSTQSRHKQPVSPNSFAMQGGTHPLSPQDALREKRPVSDRGSHAVHSKELTADPGILLLPKKKAPDTLALIKPKDEPCTDGTPNLEVPIAVIHPDQISNGDSLGVNIVSTEHSNGLEPPYGLVDEGNRGHDALALSSETRTHCELATVAEESPSKMEIDSSSLGEGTNSTPESQEKSENVFPALDLVEKLTAQDPLHIGDNMETICTTHIMSNGLSLNGHISIDTTTQKITKLPPALNCLDDNVQGSNKIIVNGCAESSEGNSESLVVIPQCELTANELRSLHDINDITKGEEKVNISWVNEINKECPPSFHYIPQNFVYHNACVNFTLHQIRDENGCPTCIGDCLESSTPCACANETGGEYAYISEGIVKESFLEECVVANHKPQKHHHFYCEACPVEKSKKDDVLEPCKGHLKRKFIKECWRKCGCNMQQCGNRVVQRGIKCKLQVFMTPDGKGWGLRTLEELPKGAFVCEYVGEILTNIESYDRNMRSTKKRSYPVLLDAGWGSGVVEDEKALCLDSTAFGNVARFINHRCLDANLVEIPVEVETPDHSYYHVALFTTRKVDALEELTRDYGIDFDDQDHPVKPFRCGCGSKFCRNMKRSNRSRSAVTAR